MSGLHCKQTKKSKTLLYELNLVCFDRLYAERHMNKQENSSHCRVSKC